MNARGFHLDAGGGAHGVPRVIKTALTTLAGAFCGHFAACTVEDLIKAYDSTIGGWARALDLRDKETEGHSRRVMEITLRLARALGLQEDEFVHIRRGALLHDIGKLGIPDAILLKPGPLTRDEWAVMRRHPVYAYQILAPIAYLHPALDIPYCHHERWDGTGYPSGLRGEEIPLAARIFAVADVWDVLGSDRPYRAAWSDAQAREYILAQAGRHFDPRIVDVFFRSVAAPGHDRDRVDKVGIADPSPALLPPVRAEVTGDPTLVEILRAAIPTAVR